MILHILPSAFSQTWILQMIMYNVIIESKKFIKTHLKFTNIL